MDINNLFANFNTVDSYAILFMLFLAFVFGLLAGYLLRGRKVRRLQKALDDKAQELTRAREELTRLQEELGLRDADLRKAQFEVEEQKSKIARLADEKTQLYNEVYTANAELERLRKMEKSDPAAVAALQATIETLQQEIKTLQQRNAQLENAQSTSTAQEEDPIDYLAQFQSTQNAMRTRLEALEEKLNRVENENTTLREELLELRSSSTQLRSMEFSSAAPRPPAAEEEEPVFTLGINPAILNDPLLRKHPERDDLTRINGISPFIEQKLNEAGIHTYQQISEWDSADVAQFTQAIGYLPGRIEQDDWIGQAIRLQQLKAQHPTAFESRGFYADNHDDLKIIEGIGPKIEALLKDAGIHTWQDLAETDTEQLQTILDTAGDSYHIHDPNTWSAQARLAANGSWELLREYQDQLKGGREVQ